MLRFFSHVKNNASFRAEFIEHIVTRPLVLGAVAMYSLALGDWVYRAL